MNIFIQKLEDKRKLIEKFKTKREDPEHSRRKPIGCGLTIHPGYGCTNKCIYCYIQDMGMDFQKANPNPYSGREILYSILKNPYFVPGETFLAFGSVTDPFHPILKEKTIEYMKYLSITKSPIQFSTKFYIDLNTSKKLNGFDKNMSGLVTIVTLKRKDILEPNAIDIEKRIETIKNLKRDIKPSIFLRPIMPKINEDEIEDIINLAYSLDVPIVFGIFRATKNNLERLGKYFDVSEILRRLPRIPKGKEQINVKMKDIIDKAIKIAEKYDIRYFIRASCHNAWAHKKVNPALEFLKKGCVNCENKCIERIPNIDEKEIEEFLKYLNLKFENVEVKKYEIKVKGKIPDWVKEWIKTLAKRILKVL